MQAGAENAARPAAPSRGIPVPKVRKLIDLVEHLVSDPTLSVTVKQQISELGDPSGTGVDKKNRWLLKLIGLVGRERIRKAAAITTRPVLPVVDRKRSARLVGAQQPHVSTIALPQLKGSRRRKRAAPHNQDWRPNAKADRIKYRQYFMLRFNYLMFPASGEYAGEAPIVRILKCSSSVESYEKVHWRQAVSREDYRERLTNNFKELEAEVIRHLGQPPRVIENAMPQLSVPFMVDRLKEFAVSSTHKELDRIQSEFTTQASSPAPNEPVRPPITPHPKHPPTRLMRLRPRSFPLLQDGATGNPHETQISQGLQGAYDLSLVSGPPPGCVWHPPPISVLTPFHD